LSLDETRQKAAAIDLPHLNKKKAELLRIELDDPVKRAKAEKEMKDWVRAFV
jgi:hypothetical protein